MFSDDHLSGNKTLISNTYLICAFYDFRNPVNASCVVGGACICEGEL